MASFDFRLRATPVELTAGAALSVEVAFVNVANYTGVPGDYSLDWSQGDLIPASSTPSTSSPAIATFNTTGLPTGTYEIVCVAKRNTDSDSVVQSVAIAVKSFSDVGFTARVTPLIANSVTGASPIQIAVDSTVPGSYVYDWSLPVDLTGTGIGSWGTSSPTSTSSSASWSATPAAGGTAIPTGMYKCKITVRPADRTSTEYKNVEACVLVINGAASNTPVWQDLLAVLKANFDEKADAIGSSVQDVADRISQLPGSTSPITVSLTRTASASSEDQVLWSRIRNSAQNMSFNSYRAVIDSMMCTGIFGTSNEESLRAVVQSNRSLPFPDVDGYRLLKVATEVFVMANAGVMHPSVVNSVSPPLTNQVTFNLTDLTGEAARLNRSSVTNATLQTDWNTLVNANGGTIPYLNLVAGALGVTNIPLTGSWGNNCYGILRERLYNPYLLELIWSYWMEEGMLVQTMNTIGRRFQNVRGSAAARDPLGEFELDPLRPINNLLWGYIQDEQHRLPLVRRAYEYHHHYGISVIGSAVPKLRPADTRSKFLEAFHQLLGLTTVFFQQLDDTTVVADGFPLLNALREVNLILSQGAHNQYGDLPWTARIEMLMQQWLLARPEMREFLRGRPMVAYAEPWMGAVDAMKKLQGWSDASIMHFRDLAVLGEQIVLSIRFGPWAANGGTPTQAVNWASYWRSEIQQYIHVYRAATGVDLTNQPVDATPPSVHLLRRLEAQRRSA
jgi:hypothetical protein